MIIERIVSPWLKRTLNDDVQNCAQGPQLSQILVEFSTVQLYPLLPGIDMYSTCELVRNLFMTFS